MILTSRKDEIIEDTRNVHKVFVYGTLLDGHGNNYLLTECDAENLGTDLMEGLTMMDLGSFPACIRHFGGEDKGDGIVVGEVWLVNDKCLKRLDQLEGVPTMYQRVGSRTIEHSEVWVYIMERSQFVDQPWRTDCQQIVHGNWNIHTEERRNS